MRVFTTIRAASLTALICLIANGASAANSKSIYKAGFTPQANFGGDVSLRLQNNSFAPILVVAEDLSNRRFPVEFKQDRKNIDLYPRPLPFQASALDFYFESSSHNEAISRTRVLSGNRLVDGDWGSPLLLTTGILVDAFDSLSSGVVGVTDTHTVSFSTTTTPISDSGIVWLIFPSGFDIGGVSAAFYWDDDPSNDSAEPFIRNITVEERSLLLHMSYGDQPALPGSRIWLRFWPVISDTIADEHTLLVMTTKQNSEIDNGPVVSNPFSLFPDSLTHLTVLPDTAVSLEAGAILDFSASGYDRYGNAIYNLSFTYDVTVDSCGQIVDSSLRGSKLGPCYVTAATDGFVDSTGLITVIPGPLDRFNILNYPSSRIAGEPFSQDIIVWALDGEDNPKYDYYGQIWFATSDTIDVLPYESGNPYTFTVGDSGVVNFSGSSFALKRSGTRFITATNGSIGVVSNPIRVSPAPIRQFLMSAGTNQIAGQSFYVNVDSALDQYANLSAGEIVVSDSIGGGPSPDGIPPSYSPIVVTNGQGGAPQTLVNAIPTMLKGVLSGGNVRSHTSLFQVAPGALGRFNIARYPDIIVAGDSFPQGISVSVFDLFGNLKTNYSGEIYFTASTDPQALLPYTLLFPFQFLIEYQGSYTFDEITEAFSLRTAGQQHVSVTDGNLEAISDAINVSPNSIANFGLSAPDTVVAGQAFAVFVQNAIDVWGNASDGIIIVSDSVGGGNSPDGIPPTFNQIAVNNGNGQAQQILTNAIPTSLKGALQGGGPEAATGLLQVLPGVLWRYEISGFPGSVVAGDNFQGIAVLVRDSYGNLKTNYDDNIYFISTDPQALLPYTQSAPFHFLPQNQGFYIFNEAFSLRTAGSQFISVTNGDRQTSSPAILVSPNVMSDFTISANLSAVAGVPLTVAVYDAHDIWGNPASGDISVDDSTGGGPSPNGVLPSFMPISVVSGSGSANQILVNAVPTMLKGTFASIVRTTAEIDVDPGSLWSFDFELSSPQTVGIPFSGIALLTAYDGYRNLKDNFDASFDSVMILSSTGGQMSNNILNQPSDFSNGVADLAAEGTTYSGIGGPMIFSAQSQGGVTGFSPVIEMNGMICEWVAIEQDNLTHGDTATGSVSILNLAGIPLDVTDLVIIDSAGSAFHPLTNPLLPDRIDPAQGMTYIIAFEIPEGFPFGEHRVTAASRGLFSSLVVTDTIAGFPESFIVEAASIPGYVSNSLSPETVSTGSVYSFILSLNNTGTSGLALYDSSHFLFTDGTRQYRSNLTSSLYLPPNSPSGVSAILDSVAVDPAFQPGAYQASFNYYGIENGLFRSGSIAVSDPVNVQVRAALTYVAGSLNVDSLAAGQRIGLSIQVQNSGDADFVVDHQNTRISFSDLQYEYVAYSDTSSDVRVDIIPQGITTFHFARTILPVEFGPGRYLPNSVFSGIQNGQFEIVNFPTFGDSIRVLSPAVVRLDSTFSLSLNAPFVNTSQPCSVMVVFENRGDEAAESLSVLLDNSGQSVFLDSILIPRLPGHQMISIAFSGVAASMPDLNDVFASSLNGGVGSLSRNPAIILPPLDNTALLVIETPARLAISPITVVDPPEADDDTISTGQPISISTAVSNLGQSDAAGARRLFLNVGSVPWDTDSLTRNFEFDQPVQWQLTAPDTPFDSALLSISFFSQLFDVNDGTSALGPDSISSRVFVIDSRPFITHFASITDPVGAVDNEISTNQMFSVTDTLSANGLYSSKGVRLSLPQGFTTTDSLVKFPQGNIAAWRLRAPSSAGNATVMLSAWIIDNNTGDSIGTQPRYINIETVSAASLSLQSRILGPPTALDGIVQPGSQVLIESVVRNIGQADVNDGQLRIQTGHPDINPLENPVRDFTVDIPLVWTLDIPSFEISQPVPISTTIIVVPSEDNTGLPSNVSVDSTSISIVVRELYPRLVLTAITGSQGSVVKGLPVTFLSFQVHNNDFGGNFPIAISGFAFEAATNPTLEAANLISAASVTSDSGSAAQVTFSQSRFELTTSDSIYLEAGASVQFTLSFTINPNTSVRDFSIALPADFIIADVIENGIAAADVLPVSPGGESVDWQSDPTAVLEQSFAASISSYPNPFNPKNGAARIGYYLPSPANLEIRIFTLLGEPVWTKSIASTDPFGSAGLHTGATALSWEGKNDIGNEIRSGVYICLIRNLSTGEEEKFKIAVVK
jgi:hypothetical protein